jgi:hypothetical protein
MMCGRFGGTVQVDEIARVEVCRVASDGERFALALEVGHQVEHTAVVDVRIRTAQPPVLGVVRPGALHVFVELLL